MDARHYVMKDYAIPLNADLVEPEEQASARRRRGLSDDAANQEKFKNRRRIAIGDSQR